MLRKTSELAIFEADGAVADDIARHETIPRLTIKHCFDARIFNLRRRHHVRQTEHRMPSRGFRANRPSDQPPHRTYPFGTPMAATA